MNNYHDKYLKYKENYKLLKKEVSDILKKNSKIMIGGGGDTKEWFYKSLKRKEDIKDEKIKNNNKKKQEFLDTIDELIDKLPK